MRLFSLLVLLLAGCRGTTPPEPVTIVGTYAIEAAGITGTLTLTADLTFTETANGATASGEYAFTLPGNELILFRHTPAIATETMTGTATLTPSGAGEFTRSGNGITVVYRKQ